MILELKTSRSNARSARRGFTILEVLIALTAALLLMLGLARAYKLLGDKVTSQQSELDLSSRLREVALRIRDELLRATCDMTPPAETAAAEGYFVYHEGPFTDSTTILGSVPHPTGNAVEYFPDSRFGDIDDYLAFTTRAKDGAPFVGFIPQGVLFAQRFANGQMVAAEINNYTLAQGRTLVPFYSNVAEIAYWLSPQWQRNSDGSLVYENQVADTNGNFSLYPLYRDRDQDLLPDRMRLHRRVLLVRPDLNMTAAQMSAVNAVAGSFGPPTTAETRNVPVIPFLVPDGSGGVQIVPITNIDGTLNVNVFARGGPIEAPGLWVGNTAAAQNTASPHWMTGIARMQQVMDLSMSRVTDNWTTPGIAPYGMPTTMLKANSLTQLSRPENRFAHVRIPQQVVSGDLVGSTMPQIALCPPHPYLTARYNTPPSLPDPNNPLIGQTPTTFPEQANHVIGNAPGDAPYLGLYGRFTMTTFLRPEFNLADRVSDFGAGGAGMTAEVNRGGSDVIADDVIGFDIQIFDPNAPRFMWAGPDRVPGSNVDNAPVTLIDDDSNGVDNDASELGWPGTDDEIVTVNDPRIDEVLVDNGNKSLTAWYITPTMPFFLVDRGDFVDLGYARLAGGPLRGLDHFDESGNLLTVPNARRDMFSSPFSGLDSNLSIRFGPPATPTAVFSGFPKSWEQSGRMVISRGTGFSSLSSFYQPVFDTWTDSYGTDPFDQEGAGYGPIEGAPFAIEVGGNSTGVPALRGRRVAQNNPNSVASRFAEVGVRRWTSNDGSRSNQGEFVDQNAGSAQAPTNRSLSPIEVSPPIPERMRAIKISIRLDDEAAGTIRQQTVIQEF